MIIPLFIAEIGANHRGDFIHACDLVRAAANAGADCVKLQCWSSDTMAANHTVRVPGGPWASLTLHDLYAKCFTPWEWFPSLKEVAEQNGIELFASAFDLPALEFLERLGVKRHKIASFELVDDELVRAAALTGKPLILSTGMATADEITHAVTEAEDMDCDDITLLKCVSAYPAPASDANLGTMRFLRGLYNCSVGLSDHSVGNAVSIAATALGASMIERHFTLTREAGGPDCAFSLVPREFAAMVLDCREAAAASAGTHIGSVDSERGHIALRRSLWWARDMAAGEMILREHVASARPADGLSCSRMMDLLGAYTAVAVAAGRPIQEGEFK